MEIQEGQIRTAHEIRPHSPNWSQRTLGRQTEGVELTLALARVRSRALVANTDEYHFKVSRSMMSHCQEAQHVHGRKV